MKANIKFLELREWDDRDVIQLANIANNENISKLLTDNFPFPYTLDDAISWVTLCKTSLDLNLAIVYKRKIAGGISLKKHCRFTENSGEIGYWLGQGYWNRGLMTEVIRQISEYSFAKLKLKKIYARVMKNNTSSLTVLSKNGFQYKTSLKDEIKKKEFLLDADLYFKENTFYGSI